MKVMKVSVLLLAAASMTVPMVAPAFARPPYQNYNNKNWNHRHYNYHHRHNNGAAIGAAVGIGLLGAAAAAAAANNRDRYYDDRECWRERRRGQWVTVCQDY